MVKKEISGMVLGQCVWYIPTCVDVYVCLFIIFLDCLDYILRLAISISIINEELIFFFGLVYLLQEA